MLLPLVVLVPELLSVELPVWSNVPFVVIPPVVVLFVPELWFVPELVFVLEPELVFVLEPELVPELLVVPELEADPLESVTVSLPELVLPLVLL